MTITVLSVILFITHVNGGHIAEVARFETMEECMRAAEGKQEVGSPLFRLACVPT